MTESSAISFEELPLSEDVLDALYDMRFTTCTPIQQACIPPILEQHDIVGIAQTGTGKTAAYLLPLLTLLQQHPAPQGTIGCLIMAPTRELAQQIDQALQGFGYYMKTQGIAVYGGNDGIRFEQEKRSFKTGSDFVIATPGRLLTHIDLGNLDLSQTRYLVLDEADRMLDMGFIDDIIRITKQLPLQRQTILFSATMPEKISELAKGIMHNPLEIKISVAKPADNIMQGVFFCNAVDKKRILSYLFDKYPPRRVIVFCSSKQQVKELPISLRKYTFTKETMHSDLSQPEREKVMQRFKSGATNLLIATDIVARGIDVTDIEMVINFDVPRQPEEYIHRIGRTARAGRGGSAYTLVCERDLMYWRRIENLLGKKLKPEPLPIGCKEPDLSQPARNAKRGGKRTNQYSHSRRKNGRNATPRANKTKKQ